MPDDWIGKWVEVETKKKTREIDSELTNRITEIIETQAVRGMTWSGASMNQCANEIRGAIRSLVRSRIDLEAEAHRREGTGLTDDRARRVNEDLQALVNHRLVDSVNTHPSLSGFANRKGYDYWGGFIDESRGPLMEEARDAVEALSLDLQRPSGSGGDTYVQNINAPNYGTIASRIETMSVGSAGDSVREALREILNAANDLAEAQQQEVRSLIEGIVKEVERGAEANPAGAAAMTGRLKEVLQTGANIAAVAQLFAPLAAWIAKLATG